MAFNRNNNDNRKEFEATKAQVANIISESAHAQALVDEVRAGMGWDERTALQYCGYVFKDEYQAIPRAGISRTQAHEEKRQREEQSKLNQPVARKATITRKSSKANADNDVLAQILAGVNAISERTTRLELELGVTNPILEKADTELLDATKE